ncbi:NAD(P)-binding protein [Proteinivorax hydrogeniformans]|uniref:NAD(P)-binding protein n=1 Tax=Proteinivorax hydrogeniformans TaxID=1826727 RepID=A0AAU8HW16_9FIRM
MKKTPRIAIMGAGVAGLACAYELEKMGVSPDIFEMAKQTGSRGFNHTLGWINLMYRPVQDPVIHLKEKYGLNLRAMEEIRRVNFYTANNSATLEGKLGYIFLSGPDERAITSQLKAHIETEIQYESITNFRELARDYDHVVVATGTPEIPKLCGIWNTDISGYVRGATVKGNFDPKTVGMWMEKAYSQSGYGYFVPWNDRKGSLILNMLEVGEYGAKLCWDKFIDSLGWDVEYEEFYETPHNIGHISKHQLGNLYFVGLAGGFIDPLFAFGSIECLASGAAAAQSIIKGKDFTELTHMWLRRNQQLLMMRRYVDKFRDEDFDRAFEVVKTPGFRSLVTRTNINIIYLLSKMTNTFASKKVDRVLY